MEFQKREKKEQIPSGCVEWHREERNKNARVQDDARENRIAKVGLSFQSEWKKQLDKEKRAEAGAKCSMMSV